MRVPFRLMLATIAVAAPFLAAASQGTETTAPPATAARAQQAFLAYCGMCHGPRGAGDGEVAVALKRSNVIVPRLDNAERLTTFGRDGVLRIILEGGSHVGRSNIMPEWGGLVGEDLAGNLADYVMTLPDRSAGGPETTMQRYLKAPPGVPDEGRETYVYRCSACHGPRGKGDGPSGELLRRKEGVRPADLTNKRLMRSLSDPQLFEAISLGGAHMGKSAHMPAWESDLTPSQIKSLVAYLRQISKTTPQP